MNRLTKASVALALSICAGQAAAATPAKGAAGQGAPSLGVEAQALMVEPATLIAVGFEWYLKGDVNRNATVAVSYRKKGTPAWHPGPPFLRILNERVLTESMNYQDGNLFAGSLFDLEPDTAYEVRFVLSDPDGVRGKATTTTVVHTRPEPMPAAGGRVFHVYPNDYKGPTQQPAFLGLLSAYYDSDDVAAERYDAYLPRVRPGDTILVHAGLYKDRRDIYGTGSDRVEPGAPTRGRICCGTTFDGTYYLTQKGTAEKPIVIKSAGDGEVIFDGDGNHTLFNVEAGDYTYFEGLTFRNTDVAIEAGIKRITGASGITVKRSRFLQVGSGVHSDWSGSKNFYIADNVFVGRNNPAVLVPYTLPKGSAASQRFLGHPGVNDDDTRNISMYAVKVYGSGHVVAFNSVRNFHDGIDHHIYGLPDGYPNTQRDRMPMSNDYYNNDISNVHDDCMELDGQLFNVRVLRNRCVNAAGSAFSMQPVYAGPAYIVRNVAYHLAGNFAALKFDGATGGMVFNNTFVGAVKGGVGPASNMHYMNNLILAEYPDDPAFAMATFTGYSTADYDGLMAGSKAPAFVVRRAPAGGAKTDYVGKLEETKFPTLAAYARATGLETHGVVVDYGVFDHMTPTDPQDSPKVYDPNSIDFRLKSGGAAIDAGVAIRGVTEGFSGKAPDLGAYELGSTPPHYGPR